MKRRWWVVTIASALVAVMALPASAAPGGSDRPFQARLVGEVTFDWTGGSASGCTIIATNTHATGNATHMGRVEAVWSHCPAEVDYVGDGRMTLKAANGDLLYGYYDYFEVEGAPMLTPIALDGGTGRFADASGEIVASFGVTPVLIEGCDDPGNFLCLDFFAAWPWWATLHGSIDM
jgi:hypothetical protein